MERLASFCEVADRGSIAAVAKGDASRQALISRQIRELESFFGTELVRRKGRGLELTGAGRDLAAVGRGNFKGLSDFAARSRKSEWLARMVASNSVAQWLLLPRLNAVARKAPGVRFEIHHEQTRDMVTGVREGIYDVAFVRKEALVPGLKHTVLGEITHSIFVPKALCKTPPKSAVETLVSLPLALPIGGVMREKIESFAARQGGIPKVAVACTSYLQAAQLVQSGMCAAVLPDTADLIMKGLPIHRVKLNERYTLCLAWTARNADTRSALVDLTKVLAETMNVFSPAR